MNKRLQGTDLLYVISGTNGNGKIVGHSCTKQTVAHVNMLHFDVKQQKEAEQKFNLL